VLNTKGRNGPFNSSNNSIRLLQRLFDRLSDRPLSGVTLARSSDDLPVLVQQELLKFHLMSPPKSGLVSLLELFVDRNDDFYRGPRGVHASGQRVDILETHLQQLKHLGVGSFIVRTGAVTDYYGALIDVLRPGIQPVGRNVYRAFDYLATEVVSRIDYYYFFALVQPGLEFLGSHLRFGSLRGHLRAGFSRVAVVVVLRGLSQPSGNS
jgi:hypothetical protein